MRAQDVEDSLQTLGADIALSTPGAFGNLIQSEAKRWGELVRALNLQVE
jgi:tripartite-type tricarboxylate transporter receptor subunit TctC